MTFEEAKALLSTCNREELRDHAFGDAEVYWMRGDDEIASGYFGADSREVGGTGWRFTGDEADALRRCGVRGRVDRNDSTGPTEYREGECMPGLTSAGVLDELTRDGQ